MAKYGDMSRNAFMLKGKLKKKGYDWWWHSFTAIDEETKQEKSFFVEYFLCNPYYGGNDPILGQKEVDGKRRKPSYLMVKCGTWGSDARQLHRFFGWNNVEISSDYPYYLEADDCYSSETHIIGSVNVSKSEAFDHPEYMCNSGSMEWNLRLNKKIAFNVGYGAGNFFRKLNAFQMYWHAEGMKTEYDGYVILDGKRYIVTPDTSYGYADKNWGSDFTSPWIWLSSNNLTSNLTGKKLVNSVFDIGGGRPKVFFVPLKNKLLGMFEYEGSNYEFNFSKFWTHCKTKFKCYETNEKIVWEIEQKTRKNKMITHVECEKKDMLKINYESPKGKIRHKRLWNGATGKGNIKLFKIIKGEATIIDDVCALNVGCEYGEFENS